MISGLEGKIIDLLGKRGVRMWAQIGQILSL